MGRAASGTETGRPKAVGGAFSIAATALRRARLQAAQAVYARPSIDTLPCPLLTRGRFGDEVLAIWIRGFAAP